MGTVYYAGVITLILVALLLTGLVLLQKGRGSGFLVGGAGGGVFGPAQATSFMTKVTAGLFGVFLVLAIALNLLGR